eukprot:GHVT01053614.1.p1 GENE.GHVT01053614.1~~GHVT01053614.1.p1  ORF type:complete len:346 (-),score=60.58 GHVT01053614.1:1310-2347(-)
MLRMIVWLLLLVLLAVLVLFRVSIPVVRPNPISSSTSPFCFCRRPRRHCASEVKAMASAEILYNAGATLVGVDAVSLLGNLVTCHRFETAAANAEKLELQAEDGTEASEKKELNEKKAHLEGEGVPLTARTGHVHRVTAETNIEAFVSLDPGAPLACKSSSSSAICASSSSLSPSSISSGVAFLDHMLSQLSRHGRFVINLKATGDLHVDDHHTVEDTAIVLGKAFDKALGDRVGIARFGSAYAPLDEALARAVVDLSGRGHANVVVPLEHIKVGDLSSQMVPHFLQSFASAARATIHVDCLRGDNDHHKVEASFKAIALAFRAAVTKATAPGESDMLPSTKEVL